MIVGLMDHEASDGQTTFGGNRHYTRNMVLSGVGGKSIMVSHLTNEIIKACANPDIFDEEFCRHDSAIAAERGIQLARQLLATMQENERLREALRLMDAYLFAMAPESNERQIVLQALNQNEVRGTDG
jgi:hypothetical protein